MIYDYIIVGCGISGLYSAYLLNKNYKVLVLEKNDYITCENRRFKCEKV